MISFEFLVTSLIVVLIPGTGIIHIVSTGLVQVLSMVIQDFSRSLVSDIFLRSIEVFPSGILIRLVGLWHHQGAVFLRYLVQYTRALKKYPESSNS